jgi:hypothetical protein
MCRSPPGRSDPRMLRNGRTKRKSPGGCRGSRRVQQKAPTGSGAENWLECRECEHQSTSPGGLHKHVRVLHGMDAWTYYQKYTHVLRLRILDNIQRVEVVAELGPCWEYQGRRTSRIGYCQMRIAGAPAHGVHRISLFAFLGEFPQDLVLHQCDNPPCCNPEHLRVGSHVENMAERSARQRTSAGAQCYHAMLDDVMVEVARQKRLRGWTAAATARYLEVDSQVIERLWRGETYQNVFGENQ